MVFTFSVIAEAHTLLAETNRVLALANAVELLKLCLIDTLITSMVSSNLLMHGEVGYEPVEESRVRWP